MVVEYECAGCGLEVQLGGFHTEIDEGFGGATLLMCAACGAQHIARHALPPEFIEQLRRGGGRYDVTLESAGERPVATTAALRHVLGCSIYEAKAIVGRAPTTIREDLTTQEASVVQRSLHAAGAKVVLEARPTPERPRVPDQRRDALLVAAPDGEWNELQIIGDRKGPSGEFELGLQRCGSCAREGSLVSELPDGAQPCPRCAASGFAQVGGWVS